MTIPLTEEKEGNKDQPLQKVGARTSYPYVAPINGGYFMDARHEGEAVGEAAVIQRNAETTLNKLDAEAQRLGKFFSELGHAYLINPAGVVIDGSTFAGGFEPTHSIRTELLDADRLREFGKAYRDKKTEWREAEKLISKFYGRPPRLEF